MNAQNQLPEADQHDLADERARLRELTSQSWNLELVISGAALFATLSLAGSLDEALTYYRYNLMPDEAYFHDILPVQIVSLCKVACYVLFGAFLANFVMRAFWVSLVGLLAAFPGGIRYNEIAMLSKYGQERQAQRLGSLDGYIIRLDQRCNVIFALASVMAIIFLIVALSYVLLVMVATLLQWYVPPNLYGTVMLVLRYVLLALLGFYMLISLSAAIPALRDHPRLAPLVFRASTAPYLLMPGIGRPVQYIIYTFFSNVPRKTLYKRFGVIMIFFILIELVVMFIDVSRIKGLDVFDNRAFMSLNAARYVVNDADYDNLRPAPELADLASIQADVIREPYLRLFVAYPKQLDEDLLKLNREPVWPDTLTRQQRRERRAAWRLNAISQYFGVYINDSLYRKPDFLFTERTENQQRGLTAILLPGNLLTGKNTLRLTIPDSTSKPKTYTEIPFWYIPE
ncbi:MAG: hypothetical protein H7319_20330 [Spirosoma sp.]|nr:hypothetical protein [Spirosoma sp.]